MTREARVKRDEKRRDEESKERSVEKKTREGQKKAIINGRNITVKTCWQTRYCSVRKYKILAQVSSHVSHVMVNMHIFKMKWPVDIMNYKGIQSIFL